MNNMNSKPTKSILLALGLLLLALAVFVGFRFFPETATVVASNPSHLVLSTQGDNGYESIQDATVPLAGATTDQIVNLITDEVAVPTDATVARPERMIAKPTATPTAAPTATPTAEPTATPTAEPTATPTAAPTATPTAEPTATPTAEPTATPVPTSSSATRLLERANALLAQYNACLTAAEKKALLEAPNYSLGNDAFRTKILADMGGSWEQLEEEVVDATQYQQDKTLYVQLFMSGLSSDLVPVVYTTLNSDRSGNQWATNLVYDDESDVWMEYTQKHSSNDSRVGYYMTNLRPEDSYDALKDTMETSPVWQEVVVPESDVSAPADPPVADPPVADPPVVE